MDLDGVIVNATVDRGISPTATSARVTFDQTQSLLVNVNKMTIALRFKTPAAFVVATQTILAKTDVAGALLQFWTSFYPSAGVTYLMTSIGNAAGYFYPTDPLVVSTEYVAHLIFDGTLGAGVRAKTALQGQIVSTGYDSIPSIIQAGPYPVTVLNRYADVASAPPNDFILRSVKIFDFAMTAEEVLDDYQQDTMFEVTP
jgi:hypothetical protein